MIKVDRLAQPAVSTYLDGLPLFQRPSDLSNWPLLHFKCKKSVRTELKPLACAFFFFASSGLSQGADAAWSERQKGIPLGLPPQKPSAIAAGLRSCQCQKCQIVDLRSRAKEKEGLVSLARGGLLGVLFLWCEHTFTIEFEIQDKQLEMSL